MAKRSSFCVAAAAAALVVAAGGTGAAALASGPLVGGALQPNGAGAGTAGGGNKAAPEHAHAAAVHTKQIYFEEDYDRLCAPSSVYRKRGAGANEVCLREWAVLIMDEASKARLVEEVAGSQPGTESSSEGTYSAVVCRDLDWRAGAADSAPCPPAGEASRHFVEPGLAERVHARWLVENAKPLRVRWDNSAIVGSSKPRTAVLGRDTVRSHEAAKVALTEAEVALAKLVDEQQLFLGPLLAAMYAKVPESDRPKDVSGAPFPEMPVRLALKIRADFVAAAEGAVDDDSRGKVAQMRALVKRLGTLDAEASPTTRIAHQARDLAAQVAALAAAVRAHCQSLDRKALAQRLNLVATRSLYSNLGLDKGDGPTPEVEEAARAAAQDDKNVDEQVERQMQLQSNHLAVTETGVDPDLAAVDARLAALAKEDPNTGGGGDQ